MATLEVVIQSVNEHIGVEYFKAVDIGESIYVHVFGAYFGLAVAKVLNNKKVDNARESSVYHSDLFSMIGKQKFFLQLSSVLSCSQFSVHLGTLFLWLYWVSLF